MDFLERIFAISPDGGSGATELAVFGVIALALAASQLRRVLWFTSRASRTSRGMPS
jgi:hypothetical protein